MSPAVDRLRSIKTLPQLIAYLRDELDWPIDSDDAEEVLFDYSSEELGLDKDATVGIKEIRQLRPLDRNQPWGIFWVNFEKKRLPVVIMRKILRALVVKKRDSGSKAERQAWQPHDLLFISAFGEEKDRAITFAHFVDHEGSNLAELRVLGWDDDDTPLHLDWVAGTLRDKLTWDERLAQTPDRWRKQWSDAFTIRHRHVITTSAQLADELARLARKLRTRIRTLLRAEGDHGQIRKLQRAFRDTLIHDLNDEGFADMFAQAVTYGLFSVSVRRTMPGLGTAVVKDDVPNLIFTSPFLKEMLGVFLGIKSRKGSIDFDELGVSDVTDLLTSEHTHMEVVLRDFNNRTRGDDPVIHFYEDFLTAYDKAMKVKRGVFYTPQPVVSYIVRSVHELLQTEFGLEDGLASTLTWGEMIKKSPGLKLPPLTDEPGEKRTISPDEFFVQILDPATGTATFLVEVIEVIHRHLKMQWEKGGLAAMPAIANPPKGAPAPRTFDDYWNVYVPKALLPRLHGYELMMAPYAIAHMKLGLKLSETNYRFAIEEPARIYLTNALEPWAKQLPLIGFDALAHEAAAVNEIKRHKRFTVVIGNPPYSNYGMLNKNPFILGLLEDYKRGLDEKKLNLDDDFIKFVRFAQHLLDGTQIGVCGMITNNTYLDGLTHRRMRSSLCESFSGVAVLDLHGSSKRQEKSPTGGTDENVFDIQTGVAVTLLLKNDTPFVAKYAELWGACEIKYEQLNNSSAHRMEWVNLLLDYRNRFFRPKKMTSAAELQTWHALKECFRVGGCGIKTERDRVSIHWTHQECQRAVEDFRTLPEGELRKKYDLETDSRDWKVANAKADVRAHRDESLFCRVLYRPFDVRHIWYSGQTRGFVGTPGYPTMRHMLDGRNLALLTCRQQAELGFHHAFCTRLLAECCTVSLKTREITSVFPLYLLPDEDAQDSLALRSEREPNFAPGFLRALAAALSLTATGEDGLPDGLTAEDIFQYIYAVFHSPGYRSRYAELLKIDFPRLPLTRNLKLFRALAGLGGDLTALHLLESPKLDTPITEFCGPRNPEVEKVSWSKKTVWIDKAQAVGFRGVREEVWNFHIGGYQVCEKWLKDRKGRTLSKDDIAHYHKIAVALSETIRLMAEIDQVIEKHGGWPGAFITDKSPQPTPAPAPQASPKADLGIRTEGELPLG